MITPPKYNKWFSDDDYYTTSNWIYNNIHEISIIKKTYPKLSKKGYILVATGKITSVRINLRICFDSKKGDNIITLFNHLIK